MERRFFSFAAHLLVTLTAVTDGRLLEPYNPSRAAKVRQEYARGPIRLELKATNTDNKDLGILLETIIDVKDFVRLVHAIAVNHLDGIDPRDVNDRTREKQNFHGPYSLLEKNEDKSHSDETPFGNDALVEYEIRQELLGVSSNLRRQPDTLNALAHHFHNVVGKVLTRILADLKNQSEKKQKLKSPIIRKRVTRIEEIAKIINETIAFLRTKPQREKPIVKQTPNLWDVDFPTQPTSFDTGIDRLSELYEETKILQRLVLENFALCDFLRHQEKVREEGPFDLNEAFEFFMSSSERFKITDELQKRMKVVLERIINPHVEKSDNQPPVDYQEQTETTDEFNTNETSINLEYNNKKVAKKRPRLHTIQHDPEDKIPQSGGEISTTDQNRTHDNEPVTVSHLKNTASQKNMDGNVNVPELQTPTDSDYLNNSDEVLPARKASKDFEEEKIMTEVAIADIGKEESRTDAEEASEDNDDTNLIMETLVPEVHIEVNKFVQSINSSTPKFVAEEHDEEAENTNATDPSIDTIRNEDNEGQIENETRTDLSLDPIATEEYENNTANIVTESSIDIGHNVGNKTIHLSINPNEIVGNIDNTLSSQNYTINDEGTEEQTESNNTEDLLTNTNLTEVHSNEPEKDEEYTENESQEANDLDLGELSSESNKNEAVTSTKNIRTNINIITFPLRSRKNHSEAESITSDIEEPDIGTTMRFGSDDRFYANDNRSTVTSPEETQFLDVKSKAIDASSSSIHSEAEPSPKKEITLPLRKIVYPLAVKLVEPSGEIVSNETNDSQADNDMEVHVITSGGSRKSLGPVDADTETKKYIMTVILDAINLLISDNSMHRMRPVDHARALSKLKA